MDKDILLKELGERIRTIREKKGITQNQLSIDCNFDKSSMSKIESGQINITYITLKRVAMGLGILVEDLLPLEKKTAP